MTRKPFYIFAIVATMLLVLSTNSCDKMSDNGSLDGMWQIASVTYNNASRYDSTVDVKSEKAYLSFQLDLAQIKWLERNVQGTSTFLSRFQREGDYLKLYDFYRHYRTTDSLFTEKDTLLLTPLGFRGFENKFQILEGGDKYMKLQSPFAIIELRKF